MHGAGNDFIIINMQNESILEEDAPALARSLCSRHTGIGADGLMLAAAPTVDADFRLLFYNSDGSLGEMCGNGARCIARYGFENGLAGEVQRIQTTAGLVIGERISDTMYRIRLNDPSVIALHLQAEGIDCSYIELGKPGIPHAVVMLDKWDEMSEDELREVGRRLRYSCAFPKGANVSFVRPDGENAVKAITFERGVEDFTLACGTGSGSIAAVMTLMGYVTGKNVRVSMPGGDLYLSLECDERIHDIFLTGPTCVVCSGETVGI